MGCYWETGNAEAKKASQKAARSRDENLIGAFVIHLWDPYETSGLHSFRSKSLVAVIQRHPRITSKELASFNEGR